MSQLFKTIGLIGKYGDSEVSDTLTRLRQYLEQRGLTVLIAPHSSKIKDGSSIEPTVRKQFSQNCDLIIVVGGDGTLLNTARTFSQYDIPLVGVNLGRLGFLVDVSQDQMTERLDEILAGNFSEDKRILLTAVVERDNEVIFQSDALNDVVIHKWGVARMMEFETWINGHFVHTQRSDGMIISTPTGSTAYALSGGGPILHFSLQALVLVPICPHTLSNRPIVVNADNEIDIQICGVESEQGQLTCDGQIHHRILAGDRVRINALKHHLRLLHPTGYDYYQILRAKLRWAEQLEN